MPGKPGLRAIRGPSFLLGAALAALVPLSASAVSVSPLDCAGPNACRIRFIYTVVFWLGMFVLVVVGGLIVFAAIRFRRRDETEPAQIHGHGPTEIAWTVGPFLILIFLFGLSFANMSYVKNGPQADMTIKVVGLQFSWQYIYPDGKVILNDNAKDPQAGLRVPVGQVIKLEVTSRDVLHSYWIPQLAGQTYAIPNQINNGWFKADKPGTYLGQCNELCGIGHPTMQAKVIAMPKAEFDTWYAAEQKARAAQALRGFAEAA